MRLGMAFPADPGTTKDVATVSGRGYGLFRLGVAGMAGAATIKMIVCCFPLAFCTRFTRMARLI